MTNGRLCRAVERTAVREISQAVRGALFRAVYENDPNDLWWAGVVARAKSEATYMAVNQAVVHPVHRAVNTAVAEAMTQALSEISFAQSAELACHLKALGP